MTEITIKQDIDPQKLWEAVFGSSGEQYPWWHRLHFVEGDWETPGAVEITAEDQDDDEAEVSKVFVIGDIIAAYEKVMNVPGGVWHCFESRVGDLDDFDACCSDDVLQMAMYDAIVFA